MSNTDQCQRFLFADVDVRGEIVNLTDSYQQTVGNHEYPAVVKEQLGEFLAASVLLASGIKYEGRLVLQVRGDGELSLIMAECTSEGEVRGIARFEEPPASDKFSELTGQGVLTITVDSRRSEPYQGVVQLSEESLGKSLEGYFEQSEQLQSWFLFAVDGQKACGIMLQQLPANKQTTEERADTWQHLMVLAKTLTQQELLDLPAEELLHRLFHQEQVSLFEPKEFVYRCSCSRERTAQALVSIGKEEVDSIIAEHGAVNVACEFCGTEYQFDASEANLLLNPENNTVH
ncbi:33 kDa chaperonin [Pseudohongiella nitratireducens]|uniref:33 kDa chaperonin n=1 Tax=Pseudohongiella nitratireducens TaxID=1768907 RepID=A0A917LRQ3_9GAMM|nr:Hsp33 family molecular chaperone HslO [Pseudohongiella nitratireducens]MDF1622932.1 Hsp33 family molecular chaperone HslO [Pseudohongiella nitratireducens]GGG51748.1 33 kDa chaperonin [Pseudohongiella nitratireducens]